MAMRLPGLSIRLKFKAVKNSWPSGRRQVSR